MRYRKITDWSNTRILVSNDDGIHAEGLGVLESIARSLSDDVWVVAPETEQSGVAHSLTLHLPLRVRQIEEKRFAISGTPTDCVLLALRNLIDKEDKPVDLVLSGVNHGSNLGEDITYSGTVAAAMEGTLLGVPSIALSQAYSDGAPLRWDTAQAHGAEVVRKLMAVGLPNGRLYNVNFPEVEPAAVRGLKVAPQGRRKIGEQLEERIDPKGRPYYWIGGTRDETGEIQGSDLHFVKENYITVTPLCLDLTDYKAMEGISKDIG